MPSGGANLANIPETQHKQIILNELSLVSKLSDNIVMADQTARKMSTVEKANFIKETLDSTRQTLNDDLKAMAGKTLERQGLEANIDDPQVHRVLDKVLENLGYDMKQLKQTPYKDPHVYQESRNDHSLKQVPLMVQPPLAASEAKIGLIRIELNKRKGNITQKEATKEIDELFAKINNKYSLSPEFIDKPKRRSEYVEGLDSDDMSWGTTANYTAQNADTAKKEAWTHYTHNPEYASDTVLYIPPDEGGKKYLEEIEKWRQELFEKAGDWEHPVRNAEGKFEVMGAEVPMDLGIATPDMRAYWKEYKALKKSIPKFPKKFLIDPYSGKFVKNPDFGEEVSQWYEARNKIKAEIELLKETGLKKRHMKIEPLKEYVPTHKQRRMEYVQRFNDAIDANDIDALEDLWQDVHDAPSVYHGEKPSFYGEDDWETQEQVLERIEDAIAALEDGESLSHGYGQTRSEKYGIGLSKVAKTPKRKKRK